MISSIPFTLHHLLFSCEIGRDAACHLHTHSLTIWYLAEVFHTHFGCAQKAEGNRAFLSKANTSTKTQNRIQSRNSFVDGSMSGDACARAPNTERQNEGNVKLIFFFYCFFGFSLVIHLVNLHLLDFAIRLSTFTPFHISIVWMVPGLWSPCVHEKII